MLNSCLRKSITNQIGSSLSLVLIIMMLIIVMITGIMTLTLTNQKVGIADKDYSAIYYATEGVLQYELDKADAEINQLYINSPDKQSFINSIDDTVTGYVATVNSTDYSKGNFDDPESEVQLSMETVVGDDWSDDERVYLLKAIGNYGEGNDAIATRKAILVSNITVQWIEKTTGGGTSGLSEAPMWVGNGQHQSIQITDSDVRIGTPTDKVNIAIGGSPVGGNNNWVITGTKKFKINGTIYVDGDQKKKDILQTQGNLSGSVKTGEIPTYISLDFPANETNFYNIIKNNNTGVSGGKIEVKTIWSGTDTNIYSTTAISGTGTVVLNNGRTDTETVTHVNGGEFHYDEISVNDNDVLTIHSDKDLEIYCETITINNGAKVIFDGEGQINLYVNSLHISGTNSLLGRASIPSTGEMIEDVVFTPNYLEVSGTDARINANVFANANVKVTDSSIIQGLVMGSNNVTRIDVTPSGILYGGVYAPSALIDMRTNPLVNTPVVCNTLYMTNNSKIENVASNIANTETILQKINPNIFTSTGTGNSTDNNIVASTKPKRTYN